MIHILGYEKVPEFKAFDTVKEYLEPYFDEDLYLGAFCANPLGIELKEQLIYNLEYLHDDSPLWSVGYDEILRNNTVLDFSRSNIEYLDKKGIKAHYMPYGINDKMRKVNPCNNKDIDILFIGSTHFDRRMRVINKLSEECAVFVAKNVYGDELDELISRSKIHLNMHHAEGQPLETVRINYLLANNCTVVSEYGSDSQLNDLYKNSLVFSSYDDLTSKCLEELSNFESNKILYINDSILYNPREVLDLRGN